MVESHNDLDSAPGIKQLSYFIALAEHGSISSAAKTLDITQPTLSLSVGKMEKQLSTQLVVRSPYGVQLTEAGAILAKWAKEVMGCIDSMFSELHEVSSDPSGPVSLGMPPSLSVLLGVPLLETISYEHPLIRLHIAEALSADVLDWVAASRVDVGYAYEVSESDHFRAEPFAREELFLVTAPDNWQGVRDARGLIREPVPANRLAELPLVLHRPGRGAIKMKELISRAIGREPNVVSEIDPLPHIIEMVSRASAYSVLPHGAVVKPAADGLVSLVPIEPKVVRTAYKVRSRLRPVTHAALVVERYMCVIMKEAIGRYDLRVDLLAPADFNEIAPKDMIEDDVRKVDEV